MDKWTKLEYEKEVGLKPATFLALTLRTKAQQGFIGVTGRCAEDLFVQIYSHSSKATSPQPPVEPTYESLPLVSSYETQKSKATFLRYPVEGSSYETISHQPWVEDEPSEATTPFETNSSLPETHDATRLGSGEIDTSHQASGSRQSGRRNLHISGFSLNGEH
ncbi:unnamed protein product [Protopolystoma xenopodis]|uniref:Uncharacterized protein n=1 Tax=Protopolystoma xenopodis TaxID=117903 RepID=A0A3S4ZPK6_9PLAT|nr:unnamed protein product [Protopolystoma xenopodis]